jgi:hypothetical protein
MVQKGNPMKDILTVPHDDVLENDPMYDELLCEEIYNQIKGVSLHKFGKNFLDMYYRRYVLRKELGITRHDENDPEASRINDAEAELVYKNVVAALNEWVGIHINTGDEEYNFSIINMVYSMLIFQLHSNIIEVISYILANNKAMYVTPYESEATKNLSIKLAKKQYKHKVDAIISVKYREIIMSILTDREFMNPECIIKTLYKINPDNYEYKEIYNLFECVYLTFNFDTFFTYIQHMYLHDYDLKEQLEMAVIEKLLPLFKFNDTTKE